MKKISVLLASALLFVNFVFAQDGINSFRNPEITKDEIYEHIKYLASDKLEGRYPGTQGDILARKYLSAEFEKYGLTPKGDSSYIQFFEIKTGYKLGGKNSLSITSSGETEEYEVKKDFIPLGLSYNGKASGDIVFCGYGISAPPLNYDDFKDENGNEIDVKGKIVVIMRYSPTYTDVKDDSFRGYEEIRIKMSGIRNRGPAGVIMISGPLNDDDNLIPLAYDMVMSTAGIPVINAKRNIIEGILKESGIDLKEIQKSINETKKPKSFAIKNASADFEVTLKLAENRTGNVLGLVEGSDPVLKNEVIVIGAHFDHLGHGGSNSLYRGKEKKVHYGADDNASGTSGVLELAQKISAEKDKFKRSVLFICFSGEEEGLLGSAYFTKSELFKRFNITAMINMDMIGRLKDNKLIINGTGTSSYWTKQLDELNAKYNFTASYKPDGFGPSDHSSFYSQGIPVLMFFTDLHSDYHTPEDTYDKINTEGEAKVLGMVYDLVYDLSNTDQKIDFTKPVAKDDDEKQERKSVRVYVGTIPDFSSTEEGYKISGVSPDSPAEKAGIKAGDIMIKFGGKEVKNIYDYTAVLGEHKPGQEVDVVLLRDGQEVTVKVTLGKK